MMHVLPGVGGLITSVSILTGCAVASWATSDEGLYTFESRGPGSFEPRLANYSKITETMIGLATGSIVLLAGSAVVRTGGHLPWFYASPLVLLGMSVVYAFAFLVFITFFYEAFLHDADCYTRNRHAIVVMFGFGSFITFAVGYVWLGFAIANS